MTGLAPVIVAEVVEPAATGRYDHERYVDLLVQLFLEGISARPDNHTRRAYTYDLGYWIRWCDNNGVDPLDARPAHVKLWLAWLEQPRKPRNRGDSEATRARRLAAVGSWYRDLVREERAPRNPTDLHRKERPRVSRDRSPTAVMSVAEFKALLAAADQDRSPRTAAVVYLLLYTGIRVGELVGANIGDIVTDLGHPVLEVRGKGRRNRTAPLPPAVMMRLEAYLNTRHVGRWVPALPGQVSTIRRPLISTATGQPIQPTEVRRMLHALALRAGLTPLAKRLSPHSMRHTFATTNLAAGVPLKDVQDAMGHASPVTTRLYDHSGLHPDNHPAYKFAAIAAAPAPEEPSGT